MIENKFFSVIELNSKSICTKYTNPYIKTNIKIQSINFDFLVPIILAPPMNSDGLLNFDKSPQLSIVACRRSYH